VGVGILVGRSASKLTATATTSAAAGASAAG